MTTQRRFLLALTFAESFGTTLLQRGLYFYTHDVLGYSELSNLWLAFAFGVTYIAGALMSHNASVRIGEKRLILSSLALLCAVHVVLTMASQHSWLSYVLMAAFPLLGFLQGIKWPVIESYVSAGHTPTELVTELGRYNTTWAVSVPLAVASSGPLIALGFPGSLFAAAASMNVVALVCATAFDAHPEHLDHADPARPKEGELRRLGALLVSARWCLLFSYSLLFLLAPLMPSVLARFDLTLTEATSSAGVLDLSRVVCFVVIGAWHGWRGRPLPLVLAIAGLPLGFALILFGNGLPMVLAGEVLYGLTAGFCYTAALYYALVVKNASVDAGGAHEGLIGVGLALGPLTGIVAQAASATVGSSLFATLLSVAPIAVVCTVLGLRSLRPSAGAR